MKKLLKTKAAYWLLGLLGFVLFSSNNQGIPLYILDEVKNAEAAREMIASQDYLVPHFNGELRTDKPPFHYYFMVAAYQVMGVSPWSARFFSAIMGVIALLVTFGATKRYLGVLPAWWTALALLASLHWVFEFHLSVPDPYLICCITLALLFFFRGYTEGQKRWLFGMYVCIGFGALAKGPIAIALPGLIFLLYILYKRDLRWRSILRLQPVWGALLVLLIAAPWYLAVHAATDGAWTQGFFIDHNLDRFSDTKEGHGGLFLYTPLVALLGLMPFSVFVVQALRKAWQDRHHDLLLFSLIATGTIIGFFAISSTKLPNYAMPAYPFLAILLGYFFAQLPLINAKKYKVLISLLVLLLICMALPAGAWIALSNDPNMPGFTWVAYTLVPLPVGVMLALWFYRSKRWEPMGYALAGAFIITGVLVLSTAYPALYGQNPVATAMSKMEPGRPLIYYRLANPAFVFHARQIIPRANDPATLRQLLDQQPNAYVITRKRYWEELAPVGEWMVVDEQRDTFERPVTLVLELP